MTKLYLWVAYYIISIVILLLSPILLFYAYWKLRPYGAVLDIPQFYWGLFMGIRLNYEEVKAYGN